MTIILSYPPAASPLMSGVSEKASAHFEGDQKVSSADLLIVG
jgi:hypothetical protein